MAGRKLSTAATLFTVLLVALGSTVQAKSAVKIWTEPLTLPTYKVAEPDSNPMFFKGEVYQGASKVIYPYPFLDNLTHEKVDKAYNTVYLENDYVKISFIPELGGRLFSALDKTNNYDYFYRQQVIKPALIGMLGAWVSGGIEWCVLHHHRNTTYMPVDYTLIDNPDGSKTFWFGETELRHRIKWIIGATIYPDKSYLKITGKIFNRTPYTHSFLFWANVAVHANDNYQTIFPPSVDYAVYHAKNQFVHWPIGHSTYRGVEYDGVDLSRWQNHPQPISFFAWNMKQGFSGGYDHGKQAGVVSITNRHISPNGKLWEWGPGPRGKMWDKILADNADPYAELMVGAYSDNQPDYSWIKPYEVKTWTMYWYPVREIGGFKNANLNAAVNLELPDEKTVKFGFNATSPITAAQAVLKAGDKLLYAEKIYIGPDKPFVKEVALPEGTKETDLEAILYSADKDVIISYKPVEKKSNPDLPPTVEAPPKPADVNTIEELYLIGQRIQQFGNPTVDPYPYFEEALKRDPGDSRVNTALGIDYNKKAMFAEAEKKLQTAVARIGKDYTRPRNCEAYYQLAIAHRALGKIDDAYENFYRAAWDAEFHSPAYHQLAELSCSKGDLNLALEQIENALSTDARNTKMMGLKVAILRKLGRFDEAKQLAAKSLATDPLDFLAANETYLIQIAMNENSNADKTLADLKTKMRDETQAYLELAVDYLNFGLYDNAIDILQRAAGMNKKPLSTYPLVYYYLGYLNQKKGDDVQEKKFFAQAAKMPPDFCFPFRSESLDVLNAAINQNPNDARAYYYLGNFLYDKQPENAVTAWEKSVALDPSFATVHRNLGWAYYRSQNDIPKAIESYEKSVQCSSKDPRVLAELDMLYEIGAAQPDKRLAMLEKNIDTARKRDDSFLQYISVLTLVGRYDEAIECLKTNYFNAWEGSGKIQDVYVDAHLLRCRQKYVGGDYKAALDDLLAAEQTPENIEIGSLEENKHLSRINYTFGAVYEAMRDSEKAGRYYQLAAEHEQAKRWPQTYWFRALAMKKTGQPDEATKIFDELIEQGNKDLSGDETVDFFAKFGEKETKQMRLADAHFTLALGYLGLGQLEKAQQEFQKAVELNPNHLWAKAQLAVLER